MSDIVFGGWSDTWRTDLGYASVRSPDIRPPPQTIKSADRKAQIRKAFVPLTGLICAFRSADFQVVFILRAQPRAQSLFSLFPIVLVLM